MDRPSLRGALPFVVCAGIGVLTLLLPPYDVRDVHRPLAGLLLAAVLLALAVSLRRPHRTWVDAAPVYLYFALLAVLFDGTGGASSNLGPLVGLGLVWVALYGTRVQVYVGAVLTGLLFLAPMMLVGGASYPAETWPRGVLWTAVAALVCPGVHEVVRQWRLEHDRLRALQVELEEITRGSRLASMVSTDLEGTIRTFGVGAERLLGYTADQVVGRYSPALFHDAEEVAEMARELGVEPGFAVFADLARREAPSRIWTYVTRDGRRVHVRLAVSEMHGADGAVNGYLGVAIDSTEAILAHRELVAAQNRWEVAMDHLPDTTVLTLDAELNVGLVTGGGSLRVGMKQAEGRNLAAVSKAENLGIAGRLVSEALVAGAASADMVATVNGHEHELVATLLPGDGERSEVLLVARDVSRIRRHEREIQAARTRAERLFEDAPHGVAVLRVDGVALQVNSALCDLLGRDRAELVGSRLSLLSYRPGDSTVQEHLSAVRTGVAGRTRATWVVRGGDGAARHVDLSSTLLGGAPGDQESLLVHVVDVSERNRYETQLAHLADHDPLTGLANRRRFEADLAAHLDQVHRHGPSGAVLMLDLDHFKDVNDTLGHGVGDQLIVSLADLLRRRIRATDLVARLGGDEFAILLPDADEHAAAEVARDVVRLVREHVASLDGVQRRVTVSVGAMLVDSADLTCSEVMSTVDMMLYDAKDAGRDQFALLDSRLQELPRTGTRMLWNERLETALDQDSFELQLQPILDLRTGAVDGAEVLLRMRDGDELIAPGAFLPIAERTHMIVRLDRWVLRRSVALLAQLQEVSPGFRLEVNLSGRSVGDPLIEQELVEAIARHGVDPSGLVLEITETAAVAHIDEARQFAERIIALGCRFALDDFGAGFGSFYYLKHLLFDFVKIDGEFIAQCDTSKTDRTILASIVQMARGLGKQTIAEFVSRPAILDVVREQGVDYAQGYYVGRPTSVPDFLASLSSPVPERSAGWDADALL